mmetsp:Transcript_39942/g.79006  ORF Transcript_39942/g.79006 Transcript_39942/m.79006 type:complete len:81 (+) Transcript_39942:528-770(+)
MVMSPNREQCMFRLVRLWSLPCGSHHMSFEERPWQHAAALAHNTFKVLRSFINSCIMIRPLQESVEQHLCSKKKQFSGQM